MNTLSRLPRAGHTPRVSATADGSAIVVRVEAVPAIEAPDELIAFPFGLEASAARKLVREGTLTAAKIGRRTYAKRSAILALVDKLADESRAPADDPETAYRAIVRKAAR